MKDQSRKGAKALVMQPLFKQRVQKDKTKYKRKPKHKGREV